MTSAEDGASRIGDGATVVAGFLPLPYIILAVVGAALDRDGLPLSPLLAAVATVPLFALLEWIEDVGNRRSPTWMERYPRWLWIVGGTIYVLAAVPLVVGLLWPLPVFEGLARGVAFWLHFVPLLALITYMGLSRYRYLRSADG